MKNILSLFTVIFLVAGLASPSWGQELRRESLNPELLKIAEPSSTPEWIRFRKDTRIAPAQLFESNRKAFGLSSLDKMRLQSVQTDGIGFTHFRYQQHFQGIPVWNGDFIVHADGSGRSYGANGHLATGLNINAQPSVSEDRALRRALSLIDERAGLWNFAQGLSEIPPELAEFYNSPKGELVIAPGKNGYALAWRFNIHLQMPEISKAFFIDAHTGELLFFYPLTFSCDPGTVATPWYGLQAINTDADGTNFILLDDCPDYAYSIQVRNNVFSESGEISAPDNAWDDGYIEVGGGTALWCLGQTRDYFEEVHNRLSWNGRNADIRAVLDGGEFNAYWNGFLMGFGLGDLDNPNDDFTTLDIVGHEFAHAVTETAAGLVYQNESGALNESFSDIFGEMVEGYAMGFNDWRMGGDRGAFRSMADPGLYGDPDTYGGWNWCDFSDPALVCGDEDFGGVHTNSGVQNFWFFLLSEGGSGTNDNNHPYEVNGIGMAKASAIAYRNLNFYLTPNATYRDAREGALQAAIDLFGECSEGFVSVLSAWEAVGIRDSTFGVDLFVCNPVSDASYWALETLQAGGGCEATISGDKPEVVFTAGAEVVLKEGFSARSQGNSQFLALIDTSCPGWPQPLAVGSSSANTASASQPLLDDKFLGVDHRLSALPGLRLEVFPNPARGQVFLRGYLPEGVEAALVIFNTVGQPVANWTILPASGGREISEVMDTSSLPPGLYVCRLAAGGQSIAARLVVDR